MAIGIATGSLVAGRLSGNHIELGLVPLGSFGLALFGLLLAAAAPSYWWSAAALAGLGFSGGLFVVPLNALLQHRAPLEEKGRILATANVLQTVGILLASVFLWLLCLLYTSDAADERSSVDLGGRRIIKKKTSTQ